MTAPTSAGSRTKMRTITVEVPEELAAAVEARGGHIPGIVEHAMSEWVPLYDRFTETTARLQALADEFPPMSDDEVQAEVDAARREMRKRATART